MIANLRIFRTLAAVVAAGAALIGVLALVGWANGIRPLATVLPGLTPMQPNSAASVIALGLALTAIAICPSVKTVRFAARALSVVPVVIAALTITEYAFGWKLGLDQALFRDLAGAGAPTRMGLNTAIAIALLGISVMFLAGETEVMVLRAHLVAVGAAAIALSSLIGYVYSTAYLYQTASSTPMAINTALALSMLCGALYWAKPDRGLMAAVHAADGSGLMLRRLIPAAVAVPVILGWARLIGQRSGFYDTEYGVALLVLSMATIFVVLIALNSQGLRHLEAARERARAELEAAYVSIEARVADRTHELNEALARLADSERRLELATEGSSSGVLDLDLVANTLTCSKRWNEMLGREVDAPINPEEFMALVHPDDRDAATEILCSHLKGKAGFSTEVRMRRVDGSYRWMLSRGRAIRDASGRAMRMIGSQTDITEIKDLQEQLRDASIRDPITGLYNRAHLVERLTAAMRLAIRHDLPLSFCMCDIDRFKQINDTYGHQIGDAVIRAVGEAIAKEIRTEDVGARYGGDEFCITFVATPASSAAACVERIKHRVESTPFFAGEARAFSVTLSFGIADLGDRSISDLIEAADQALYLAKSRGRSRIIVDDSGAATRREA